jgi:D-glycero-D-manno-heptose 1,7-bisphosphate phosphatase
VSGGTRRALFLDRDGIVNLDSGYTHRIEDFHFREGIFDLVRQARERGLAVVIVTNQAGIGRGYYTEGDFQRLTQWMLARFREQGAPVDRVYHCPYHPEHGVGEYRRESDWRKPAPGMLLQAAADLGLDLAGSVLVGDSETDIEAGRRAGLRRTILVADRAVSTRADHVVASLPAVGPLL